MNYKITEVYMNWNPLASENIQETQACWQCAVFLFFFYLNDVKCLSFILDLLQTTKNVIGQLLTGNIRVLEWQLNLWWWLMHRCPARRCPRSVACQEQRRRRDPTAPPLTLSELICPTHLPTWVQTHLLYRVSRTCNVNWLHFVLFSQGMAKNGNDAEIDEGLYSRQL